MPALTEPATSASPTGDLLLGRYEIEATLGRGAMGEVLKVRDRQTDKRFALKRVPPEVTRQSGQMDVIRANFKLVSDLAHPHIAVTRFLETDPHTGDLFVLLDYVHGCDLATWLTRTRLNLGDPELPLPMPLVLGIAEQIASALDYAHSQPTSFAANGTAQRYGIVHRDLKPQNVMVEHGRWYREGVPFLKIVDFGIAAEIQASLASQTFQTPAVNQVMGTPVYMAPEQWLGRRVTRAIDQWALAVMIYEMAEGQLPFFGLAFEDLRQQVLSGRVNLPEQLTSAQWQALRPALDLDRRHRYRSCMAMVKSVAAADSATRQCIQAAELAVPEEASLGPGATLPLEGSDMATERLWAGREPQLEDTRRLAGSTKKGPATEATRWKTSRAKSWLVLAALLVTASVAVIALWEDRGEEPQPASEHAVVAMAGTKQRATTSSQAEQAVVPVTEAGMQAELRAETERGQFLDLAPSAPLPLRVAAVQPQRVATGQPLTLQVVAHDPNAPGAALRFELHSSAPPNAEIHPETGHFRWTPPEAAAGKSHTCMVVVTSTTAGVQPTMVNLTIEVVAAAEPAAAPEPPAVETDPAGKPAEPPLLRLPFSKQEAEAARQAWTQSLSIPAEISLGDNRRLVLIPPGEFPMGSTPEEVGSGLPIGVPYDKVHTEAIKQRSNDEHPRHWVRITRPFYLGSHEVTRQQFAQFVEATGYQTDAEKDPAGGYGMDPHGNWLQKPEYSWKNPGFAQNENHPVVNVSWNDALAFCEWLSRKEGRSYRLPTEAQWEYACRAGTATLFYCGDDQRELVQVANGAHAFDWSNHQDGFQYTAPVGLFRANAFGLFDMYGNADEWCSDWYGSGYYEVSPAADPAGPLSGTCRVCRGGSWWFSGRGYRSAVREWGIPFSCDCSRGFRLALNAAEQLQ